jgi:hypothetical protein
MIRRWPVPLRPTLVRRVAVLLLLGPFLSASAEEPPPCTEWHQALERVSRKHAPKASASSFSLVCLALDVGAYPQLQEVSPDGNWDINDPKSAYGLVRWNGLPASPPPFGTMPLANGARLTEVLSAAPISGYGLIVDARTRAVLSQLNLGRHAFHPLKVRFGERVLPYDWLQLDNDVTPLVDFAKSEFWLAPSDETIAPRPLRSANEAEWRARLARLRDEPGLGSLAPKHVVFVAGVEPPDLFHFPGAPELYASKRLMDAFRRGKIRGVLFAPTVRVQRAPEKGQAAQKAARP